MKKKIRGIITMAMILVMALAVSSCGTDQKSSGEQVARINEVVITDGELDTFATLVYYIAGYDPSEMSADEKKNCLNTMVECEAIRQYYEEQGRDIYNDEYDSGKSNFISSIRESGADYLEENDITDDDLIYYYRSAYLSQILYKDVQEEHDSQEIEAAAEEYYNDNIDKYIVNDSDGNADGSGKNADSDAGAGPEGEKQYKPFEEVKDSIEYTIYSQYYLEKIAEIKESMDIEMNEDALE